ncbi:hypothetical protein [Actinorugispora endophytica]|uniref:Uncharacterized protein n=1 Tax=Actinorugispora endophytica TaxID=1605990 RepID=A0A4R6V7U0_9ACTN|nr:hypothetical protein [Actinorugispora endophytica]TDQ55186.1 hypothetical protein EV190_101511 [Actinorugispora endophytica]
MTRPRLRLRLRLDLALTAEQEQAYRFEHGLGPEQAIRDHVRDLVQAELEGLGVDWWDITID